jgi:hypothetical protein
MKRTSTTETRCLARDGRIQRPSHIHRWRYIVYLRLKSSTYLLYAHRKIM